MNLKEKFKHTRAAFGIYSGILLVIFFVLAAMITQQSFGVEIDQEIL